MAFTTVILDFSVFAHQLHDSYVAAGAENDKEHWKGILQAQATWMLSCKWLGELVDVETTQTVAVVDTKPYWRAEYLQRPEVYTTIKTKKRNKVVDNLEPIAYKGGRKLPTYHFTKTKEKLSNFCQEVGVKFLASPGYEADDLAAALVMTNRMRAEQDKHNIILATVDADWLGLVDDHTSWCCSYGWMPRLRNNLEVINQWSLKRLGTTLESPADIWQVKSRVGDKSDNLPAGTPIEVIDLMNPPDEHKLWLKPQMKGILSTCFDRPEPVRGKVLHHVPRASEYLRQLGIPRFVKSYNSNDTKQPYGN